MEKPLEPRQTGVRFCFNAGGWSAPAKIFKKSDKRALCPFFYAGAQAMLIADLNRNARPAWRLLTPKI
ncbi:hypothetical protein DPQ22_09635 [Candidatus Tokpelaia sp.]|nr:hypothetical protein DPQ22_09635 [Candidatus Tokpelaia sp.]